MKAILAILKKDLLLLIRDKLGFFFSAFFPLLFAAFFGMIYSGQGRGTRAIPISVVDEDNSPESAAFIAELGKADAFQATPSIRSEAVENVRRGRKTAYVVLLQGFGAAQKRLFWGEPPKLELGLDPSRRAESGMIEGVLMQCAFLKMQGQMTDSQQMKQNVQTSLSEVRQAKDMTSGEKARFERFLGALDRFVATAHSFPDANADSTRSRFQPLSIQKVDVGLVRIGPRNAFEITFPQGIVWGLLACMAGFSIAMATERSQGTFIRLRTSAVRRWQILFGKASACFAMGVAVSIMLCTVAVAFFRVRPHSYFFLGLALVCSSAAFTGIMMLVSVLGRTEQSAAGIGWAFNTVMAMFGGGMMPLFLMPPWMRSLGNISPVKWVILGTEGAIWRGFSAVEMALPCGILLGIGVACFALGLRFFKWET
ncbi:MAG TPA: ABC transporter permease [bacterium]